MIIVITGASKGLGKAVAEKFATDTHPHTIILNARNVQALNDVSNTLQQKHPQHNILVKQCDMSVKEDVLSFAAFVTATGIPDILVNNAGSFIPGSVYNEENGALEQMMQVNLYSAYYITRALLP